MATEGVLTDTAKEIAKWANDLQINLLRMGGLYGFEISRGPQGRFHTLHKEDSTFASRELAINAIHNILVAVRDYTTAEGETSELTQATVDKICADLAVRNSAHTYH